MKFSGPSISASSVAVITTSISAVGDPLPVTVKVVPVRSKSARPPATVASSARKLSKSADVVAGAGPLFSARLILAVSPVCSANGPAPLVLPLPTREIVNVTSAPSTTVLTSLSIENVTKSLSVIVTVPFCAITCGTAKSVAPLTVVLVISTISKSTVSSLSTNASSIVVNVKPSVCGNASTSVSVTTPSRNVKSFEAPTNAVPVFAS